MRNCYLIKSDFSWKKFIERRRLRENQKRQVDYIPLGLTDDFFIYDNIAYHLSEFTHMNHTTCPFVGDEKYMWNGHLCANWNAGMVIKLHDDGQRYRIAEFRFVGGRY